MKTAVFKCCHSSTERERTGAIKLQLRQRTNEPERLWRWKKVSCNCFKKSVYCFLHQICSWREHTTQTVGSHLRINITETSNSFHRLKIIRSEQIKLHRTILCSFYHHSFVFFSLFLWLCLSMGIADFRVDLWPPGSISSTPRDNKVEPLYLANACLPLFLSIAACRLLVKSRQVYSTLFTCLSTRASALVLNVHL